MNRYIIRRERKILNIKMCLFKCVLYMMTFFVFVRANDLSDVNDRLNVAFEQVEVMKTMHLTDVMRMSREIEDLKEKCKSNQASNNERNDQITIQWVKTSMTEIRTEMRELGEGVNNSVLLKQLHTIKNQLKQALAETLNLAQLSRTQEARIDKMDNEVSRLKYEIQQMRTSLVELRAQVIKSVKEVKYGYPEEPLVNDSNEVEKKPHRLRHNKLVHNQISRLAESQEQLDLYQQNLQVQMLDAQRRLDRLEEPNWYLLSAKVDFLELEQHHIRDEITNITQKVSDFDKVHASMLELREDIENIENKEDKSIPELRKEVSKLDLNYSQLSARTSYIKEDQENLRQSVKAIAVSMSNVIDRSEMDRAEIAHINNSVYHLQNLAKQHFYRLNDHILKSEATNYTEILPLPELIGEVKKLEPVDKEYKELVNQLPRDCSEVSGPPGSYLINPGNGPIDTQCSHKTTLLQRRLNGSLEFNRVFSEYVKGFGSSSSEYWLGLESMHLLTADNCSSMRIDMVDIYGLAWYAEYDRFRVGSAAEGYILDVSGFRGNASDAFQYQNHMEFSAIDRDRDISNTHCAANYEGGWWYSHCQHVNINGKYNLGLTWFDSSKNEWIAVATSEMKIYQNFDCT